MRSAFALLISLVLFAPAIVLLVSSEAARAEDAPATPAAACDLLFGKLNALDPKLADAYQKTKELDPDLVHGKKIPTWQDFEKLDQILADVRQGKGDVAAKGQSEELKKILADVAEAAKNDEKLKALGAKGEKLAAQTYRPTEYDLKALYQKKLWELDRELPKDLKIRITHIPFDARGPGLVKDARAIIAQQEKHFDELFATSGFKDDASLKAAVRAHSPEGKLVMDDLESENVDFAMRRPEGARWWTPKVGFQNQRVTGNSRGSYSPDFRDQVEASMASQKLSEYKKVDTEVKPVYGYLKAKPGGPLQEDMSATQYGEDVYVFKKDHVRDRLTWTAGDSFGWNSRTGDDAEKPLAKDWDSQFVPWKDRSLLAPDLIDGVKQKRGFVGGLGGTDEVVPAGIPKPIEPPGPRAPVAPTIAWPDAPPRPEVKTDGLSAAAAARKTAKAEAAYKASSEYRSFIAKKGAYTRLNNEYQAALEKFQKSRAYKTYLNSDAYKKYTADLEKYNQAVSAQSFDAHLHSALADTPLAPFKSNSAHTGYIELQYWGPVTFDDVESFEFSVTPPSGDFLKELQSHGVKIFDARNFKQPVPWIPDAGVKP
jgi:hypothetical protein